MKKITVYHGTSSDKLPLILKEGLKITVGGAGDGAYVTENLKEAKEYAWKRAGDRRLTRHPQFKEVYPVVMEISIDMSELTESYGKAYFAKKGIPPHYIVKTINVSKEKVWQSLLKSLQVEKGNYELFDKYYLVYHKATHHIV